MVMFADESFGDYLRRLPPELKRVDRRVTDENRNEKEFIKY